MFGHDKKMCRKGTRKEWVVKKKPTQEEVLEIHEEAKAKEFETANEEAYATPKKNFDAVIVVQSPNAENPNQNDGTSDDIVAESQNGNQWQIVVSRQRTKGKVDGYEMFKFSTKLKKVKRVLLQLNRDRFNSIDKKEASLNPHPPPLPSSPSRAPFSPHTVATQRRLPPSLALSLSAATAITGGVAIAYLSLSLSPDLYLTYWTAAAPPPLSSLAVELQPPRVFLLPPVANCDSPPSSHRSAAPSGF
ncbi:hypothetical protein RIF29_29917 [Crotalaria pallida]|uniref:Uncharacterized protein n=1 Tax=Crotalaria pallida TaxID=3830 RepID=A0AAN9EFM9_CROPI